MEKYFWQQDFASFNELPLDFFVLSEIEKGHIREKHSFHNQIVYAILLKYFECEKCFPDEPTEILINVHKTLAIQLNVPFEELKWPSERTLKRFRAGIRDFFGYREMKSQDKIDLSSWLAENILPHSLDEDDLLEASEFFCRKNKIELLSKSEISIYLEKESCYFENKLLNDIYFKITNETKEKLDGLLGEHQNNKDDKKSEIKENKNLILIDLKKDKSQLKRRFINFEINKYNFLNKIELPSTLLDQYSRKFLLKHETYVKARLPSDLKIQQDFLRHSELAIFCFITTQKSADTLADILLKTIHRIEKRAEKFVDKYILSNEKNNKVSGKIATLLTLCLTLKNNPKGVIDETVYPKISLGNIDAIIDELQNRQTSYQNQVKVKALSLYSHGCRKTLIKLLTALTFETDHKDLHDLLLAIEWIKSDESTRDTENLPYKETIIKSWGDLVQKENQTEIFIDFKAYELAVLQHFATELSVKNIWIKGAYRYKNPVKDMPSDFEEKKDYYFDWLNLPKDSNVFCSTLKKTLEDSLLSFNETLPTNDKVIFVKRKKGPIKLSPSSRQQLPTNLSFVHQEINRLWPNVALIDVLKEVDFIVGFTEKFTGLGARSAIPREKLQRRLLLCCYGLGSNIGLKRLATSHTGETYADLRYIKNHYLSSDYVRSAIKEVVNALLKIRDPKIWKENGIGCSGDSKRFNVWVQNLFGGWHGRYKAHGVMVYTHIDKKSAPIYMQLTRPGDSEVGAMLTGCLHHDTEMEMNKIHTDTHGQSSIGFAFSHLLNIDLFPRIKGIHEQKLFSSSKSLKEKLPHLQLALANEVINWKTIHDGYEEVIKHTVALKSRTVEASVLLKRLCAKNGNNPVYKALLEIGKAVRTIFLCRYLQDENFRIQINEALNIVERFHSIMGFIFHGKQGGISTNDREDQELFILCLHLIMVCMSYINTLMIQIVINNPSKPISLTEDDYRAINPLIHEHLNPHGLIFLNMTERLRYINDNFEPKMKIAK